MLSPAYLTVNLLLFNFFLRFSFASVVSACCVIWGDAVCAIHTKLKMMDDAHMRELRVEPQYMIGMEY